MSSVPVCIDLSLVQYSGLSKQVSWEVCSYFSDRSTVVNMEQIEKKML